MRVGGGGKPDALHLRSLQSLCLCVRLRLFLDVLALEFTVAVARLGGTLLGVFAARSRGRGRGGRYTALVSGLASFTVLALVFAPQGLGLKFVPVAFNFLESVDKGGGGRTVVSNLITKGKGTP